MIEVGLKFRRNYQLRCKHQIVYIPRRKHLRERWLQWIVEKHISEFFVSLLAQWNSCFDALSKWHFPSPADSSTTQIKQIYCYCSLCEKFAKRRDLRECNMIAFFHYVNFPLSSRRFFKPWSPLFHTTMKYKRNL